MEMNIEKFDYSLPKASIAQYPEKEREASRMLVLSRTDGLLSTDVPRYNPVSERW
jgi:S-adenosylmethionine:tRNA-ribosyltransferase-isomerase (queuine synthetase)